MLRRRYGTRTRDCTVLQTAAFATQPTGDIYLFGCLDTAYYISWVPSARLERALVGYLTAWPLPLGYEGAEVGEHDSQPVSRPNPLRTGARSLAGSTSMSPFTGHPERRWSAANPYRCIVSPGGRTESRTPRLLDRADFPDQLRDHPVSFHTRRAEVTIPAAFTLHRGSKPVPGPPGCPPSITAYSWSGSN